MNESLHTLMREATRLTQTGRLGEATQALQRALGGMAGAGFTPGRAPASTPGDRTTAATAQGDSTLILDGCVFEPGERTTEHHDSRLAGYPRPEKASFAGASFSHAGLTRRYKLFMPAHSSGQSLALVVMLHGCTQNPDDFATGTHMNELAREQGFMVVYPEQSNEANPQRCWNWFKHNHQRRGSGEPALIAGLAQMLVREHGINARRVYIAGLSAGGAMAALAAGAYPDVFAAVGVHSGLPGGAASNLTEAMMLMKNGGAGPGGPGAKPLAQQPVPTIVFHGDQDHTVHPRNGGQVIAAALACQVGDNPSLPGAANPGKVEQGVSRSGRRYTRSVYSDSTGAALAEHWVVHGAGHAWSGGMPGGSYTDPTGPDATREMLRFFFSQPQGSAQ